MGSLRANATLSLPLPRVVVDAFVPYAGFVTITAMLLGGGTRLGFWSDAIVQLLALPLLAWGLLRLTLTKLTRSERWGIILLCSIIILPLIQLLPLPPAWWGALPGRATITLSYEAAGMARPWLPLSLDPAATWRGFLSLLPATAIFLAMQSIDNTARRFLVALILAVAFVSVPIDLLQIMGGSQSPLRFYTITNIDRAVGFFANANHNAAFLYCAMPFAAAWTIGTLRNHREKRSMRLFLLLFLLAMLVIGLAIVLSRAGLALGFAAAISSLALAWRHKSPHSGRRLLLVGAAAGVIALFLVFQFGFVGIVGRLEGGEGDSAFRWGVAIATAKAGVANLPFGSGLGTFVPVYQMFEQRTLLNTSYVNHAHNDWLELWLTGSVPAMALALCFITWFVRLTVLLWRRSLAGLQIKDVALAQAASIVIALLMLHSIVDYPLRTTALSVFFAVACGLLLMGARSESSGEPPDGSRLGGWNHRSSIQNHRKN